MISTLRAGRNSCRAVKLRPCSTRRFNRATALVAKKVAGDPTSATAKLSETLAFGLKADYAIQGTATKMNEGFIPISQIRDQGVGACCAAPEDSNLHMLIQRTAA